jgi:DNA-binding transcriptional LysR family regulator
MVMNTRQIEYMLMIAEERNLVRASERLYISQSALSQTVIKLEDELGCKLFYRGARELTLTEEGQVYIHGAKEIMEIKNRTYRTISDMKQHKKYCIGVSSRSGLERFLRASGKMEGKWKDVEFYAVEDTFRNLFTKLQNEQLSLILVSWNSLDEILLPYEILKKEEILLVAPSSTQGLEAANSVVLNKKIVEANRFILSKHQTTMRVITDNLFAQRGLVPNVLVETDNTAVTMQMISEGKSMAFIPEGLRNDSLANVRYFSLTPKVFRYQMVIYGHCCDHDPYVQEFIDILKTLETTRG